MTTEKLEQVLHLIDTHAEMIGLTIAEYLPFDEQAAFSCVCRNSPVRGLKIAVIAIENDRGAHCYLSVSSLTPSIFKRLRLRSRPPA